MSPFRTRRQTSGNQGTRPRQATSSPSRTSPVGSLRSSGSTGVMFQPRRLRTRSPASVETIARKPSHLSSKDHSEPEGKGPGRESIGSGSRRARNPIAADGRDDRRSFKIGHRGYPATREGETKGENDAGTGAVALSGSNRRGCPGSHGSRVDRGHLHARVRSGVRVCMGDQVSARGDWLSPVPRASDGTPPRAS